MIRGRTLAIAVAIALIFAVVVTGLYFAATGKKPAVVVADAVGQGWYGFFYPGFKVPSTPEEKIAALRDAKRFQTLDECLDWGNRVTGGNEYLIGYDLDFTDENVANAVGAFINDGYRCARDCRYDEPTSEIICAENL